MPASPLVFPRAPALDPARRRIAEAWHADETETVDALIAEAALPPDARHRVEALAVQLVEETRRRAGTAGGLDAFLREHDLSSREGVALMFLAQELLRVPDAETAHRLIGDKPRDGDWERHLEIGRAAG